MIYKLLRKYDVSIIDIFTKTNQLECCDQYDSK